MTINRSKGLLGTSESIHSGSASAALVKTYLTSEVNYLESKFYCLKIKKDTNMGLLEKKGSLSRI
jgi:hypothetical protein